VLAPTRRAAVIDFTWRTAYRVAFPLARLSWRITRPRHEGALVAVYVGPALLLVRESYRTAWNLPGGGLRRGETPEATARREMAEEIGLVAGELAAAGVGCGIWDGRRDRVHFFELRLAELPTLRLDNREVTAARLFGPDELPANELTGPLAAYLSRHDGRD
jgi:8-oxo-dGTP diphosphatase